MARLGDLIAFRAAIELLKETGRESLILKVYEDVKAELAKPVAEIKNLVKEIYKPFCPDEISKKDIIDAQIRGYHR